MCRRVAVAVLLPLAACGVAIMLSGCGGGSSYEIDQGITTDRHGNKIITRSLENQSDYGLTVELSVNGRDYLDTFTIRPHDWVNVTIDYLQVDDWIAYDARFDPGDRVTGSFSEDGRTIFTYTETRAAGPRAQSIDGRSAILPGGTEKHLSARR